MTKLPCPSLLHGCAASLLTLLPCTSSSSQLRLTTAAVLGSLLWVLASHTPDMEHLKTEAKSAHDRWVAGCWSGDVSGGRGMHGGWANGLLGVGFRV